MSNLIKLEHNKKRDWFNKIINPKNNCYYLRAFVNSAFEKTLELNQFLPLRDMLDPSVRRIYYTSARQSGKTEVIATFQAIASIFPEFVVKGWEGKANSYIFAPKLAQAQISFARYESIIKINKLNLYAGQIVKQNADTIRFSSNFEVRAITASRNSEIEGETSHIIILDESQAISPYKVRECLTGDTVVPLANGAFSTVEEVVNNKLKVIAVSGDDLTKADETIPLRFFKYDKDIIYKITLSSGRILKCNSNHTHLMHDNNMSDKKKKFVKKLKTTELKIGQHLAIIRTLDYFGEEGTYDEGLIVGIFLGDNNTINNNTLTNFLRKKGLLEIKCDKKQITNRAWSKEFLKGLIIGFIETGGDVFQSKDRTGFISFNNLTEKLGRQFQDYLQKFGVHGKIFNTKKSWTLEINDVSDISKFYNNFNLTNKQESLEKLYKQKSNGISKQYSDSIGFSQIVGIEKLTKQETVYCVQVPSPNLWVANGIITGNSILPMGGGVPFGAKVIQCGVPGTLGSHFHKAFKSHYHKTKNPYGYVQHVYPWTLCNRLTKDYVLPLRNEDEDAFDRNYNLLWSKSNLGYFVTEEQYNDCATDYDIQKILKKVAEQGWRLFWGVDFAKYRDSTVITTLAYDPEKREYWLVGLVELTGIDYIAQVGLMKNMYDPSKVVAIYADATAVGDVVIEMMNDQGMKTTGLVFSTKTKDTIYKNFRKIIQTKKIHWPKKKPSKEFKRFKQQLTELEVEYRTSSGLMSVHHDLDDPVHARDDYPDSCCLGLYGGENYIEPSAYYI